MTATTVVLLHGLWMPRFEMLVLRERLRSRGIAGHLFGYPSTAATLDENAERLAEFVSGLPVRITGLVGHSLGGIVALRALSQERLPDVRRLVCLGSPLMGSRAAKRLHGLPAGRRLLGLPLSAAVLDSNADAWAAGCGETCDIGLIAGDSSTGLGRWLARFDEPNDGTVAVSETRWTGLADHLVLPVSHTGMVLSAGVADYTASFLRRGVFLPAP